MQQRWAGLRNVGWRKKLTKCIPHGENKTTYGGNKQ